MARAKKAKEEPAQGDNLKGLTDEQRQALHLNQHVPTYERALAKKKTADAEFKNACKLIKAEGGSVKKVKLSIELRTPEGEEAFRARLAEDAEVAAWNGLGIQVDFFADEDTPSDDKAFANGKRAGLAGEPAKPPHDPSTSQYRRWMEGHSEGNGILATQGFKKLQKEPAHA